MRGGDGCRGGYLPKGGCFWVGCRNSWSCSFILELFRPGSLTKKNEVTVVTFIARFLLCARIWAEGLT